MMLAAGLIILLFAAWLVVRSAANLAALLGLSPVLIGATVVAFGTSAPELLVSVLSASRGSAEIALGNVVGSNITNVALILGLSALIMPVSVHQRLLRWEIPVLLAATLALLALTANGRLGAIEGVLLFAGVIAFVVFSLRYQSEVEEATDEPSEDVAEAEELEATAGIEAAIGVEVAAVPVARAPALRVEAVLLLVSLAGLALGADLFVRGAVEVAQRAGLSELTIGATIVAMGTSLPELATSAMAAWRRQSDIAVANVVGSNIFNILAVLGAASAIAPFAVDLAVFRLEMPAVALSTLVLVPLAWPRYRIGRTEGALLFLAYWVFIALTLLRG